MKANWEVLRKTAALALRTTRKARRIADQTGLNAPTRCRRVELANLELERKQSPILVAPLTASSPPATSRSATSSRRAAVVEIAEQNGFRFEAFVQTEESPICTWKCRTNQAGRL